MQEFTIPWGQWYEQSTRTLKFPDEWEVHYCGMKEVPTLSDQEIEAKIEEPIGTERLEQLALGKHRVCVIIDDISRPTPGARVLPILLRKLNNAGIPYDHMKVLLALGGHRPMTRQEMRIKVGQWVLDHVQVLNHFPFAADLVTVPDDRQVIRINRNYMEADLRIAVGCIEPHILAGFSGGAKAVIPGIGGIETLKSNHSLVFADQSKNMSFATNTCNPDNPMRLNMERIVGKVGLDFIVNVVLNNEMDIADVFAGHFVRAHRKACRRAMEILRTPLVPDADINVLSANPKDTEYSQIGTSFAVLGQYEKACCADDASLISLTAASEGAGFHALFGPGMMLFSPHDDNMPPADLHDKKLYIISDGVTREDIRQFYRGEAPQIYPDWDSVLRELVEKYRGRTVKAAIYPRGAIQIGYWPGQE